MVHKQHELIRITWIIKECAGHWFTVLNVNLLLSDPLPNLEIETIGPITPSSLEAHVSKTILHQKNGSVRCKPQKKS